MTDARRIWMVDTTLRDGEQAPGVVFHPLEKIEIAQGLAACGIDEIEAGIPAMGETACQEIAALSSLNLPLVLSCWCRAVKAEIGLAAGCNTPGIHISFPTSSILLKTFSKTRGWVLETLDELVGYAKGYFDQISVGAQDATRTDRAFLHEFATAARDLGVHRLRIADTVGMASPSMIMGLIEEIRTRVPGLSLEFHGHNDLGMATANAVSAAEAGADALSVTINGLGERAGNAPLEEVAMALFGLGAYESRMQISQLTALSAMGARFSGQVIAPDKPIVGSRVFSHESGIHCAGLLKNPASYQPFNPADVGREDAQLVLGRHSGAALVCHMLERSGISITRDQAGELLKTIRSHHGQPLTQDELTALFRAV